MKRILIMAMLTFALLGVVPAQEKTQEQLRTELGTVQNQMETLQRQLFESPETKKLRDAILQADAALQTATAALPGIKEMDAQLDQLRRQLTDLQKKRFAVVENSAELAAVKKAAQDAQLAYRAATSENVELKALREQRRQLALQLGSAGN